MVIHVRIDGGRFHHGLAPFVHRLEHRVRRLRFGVFGQEVRSPQRVFEQVDGDVPIDWADLAELPEVDGVERQLTFVVLGAAGQLVDDGRILNGLHRDGLKSPRVEEKQRAILQARLIGGQVEGRGEAPGVARRQAGAAHVIDRRQRLVTGHQSEVTHPARQGHADAVTVAQIQRFIRHVDPEDGPVQAARGLQLVALAGLGPANDHMPWLLENRQLGRPVEQHENAEGAPRFIAALVLRAANHDRLAEREDAAGGWLTVDGRRRVAIIRRGHDIVHRRRRAVADAHHNVGRAMEQRGRRVAPDSHGELALRFVAAIVLHPTNHDGRADGKRAAGRRQTTHCRTWIRSVEHGGGRIVHDHAVGAAGPDHDVGRAENPRRLSAFQHGDSESTKILVAATVFGRADHHVNAAREEGSGRGCASHGHTPAVIGRLGRGIGHRGAANARRSGAGVDNEVARTLDHRRRAILADGDGESAGITIVALIGDLAGHRAGPDRKGRPRRRGARPDIRRAAAGDPRHGVLENDVGVAGPKHEVGGTLDGQWGGLGSGRTGRQHEAKAEQEQCDGARTRTDGLGIHRGRTGLVGIAISPAPPAFVRGAAPSPAEPETGAARSFCPLCPGELSRRTAHTHRVRI